MQNFLGTEWESMTEEEIFLSNRKLVQNTIRNRFSNHPTFCKTHMIEKDDLIQMANIGLFNAIRTYNPNGATQFRSHAINCIVWSIKTLAKKESLRNLNSQTFEIANITSVEKKVDFDDEEITLLDTLEANENTVETAEDNLLIESVTKFLKADSEVDEELLYILIQKAKGATLQQISEGIGVHPNSIGVRIKTKKAIRVKNRLMDFLRNGENDV